MNDNLTTNASNEAENLAFLVGVVSGSNSTLYYVCCSEEPHHRKKDNVEYYECPYCKQECDVEWMEDEFPDYCH